LFDKEATMPNLFAAFTLPNGVTLNNRLVMAPMTHWSSNPDGTVSEVELAYYRERNRGLGLIVSAAVYVQPDGMGFAGQFGVHDEAMLPGLRKLAATLQENGAKALLQLYHGGRMCPPELMPDGQVCSASAVPAERPGAPVPRAMTEAEIETLIANFAAATRRAIEAGFDGVEIHGANTYLLQQFFSPHSNRREDSWGGSLEKRMRLPLAVVDAVQDSARKHASRPFIIGYRFSPEETENPGITMEDTLQFADALAGKNLDYLHVSVMDFWQGSLRDKADSASRVLKVQERVGARVPIIGVGSIHTAEDARKALDSGVPLLALGRELLMEPRWAEKVQAGEAVRVTLSRRAQAELKLPDGMWNVIMAMEGWLPVVD
jgi:2,4-dienoyl-CoA reductase-like NADH-dependent reductase (Old Yellow Enzyme family)